MQGAFVVQLKKEPLADQLSGSVESGHWTGRAVQSGEELLKFIRYKQEFGTEVQRAGSNEPSKNGTHRNAGTSLEMSAPAFHIFTTAPTATLLRR